LRSGVQASRPCSHLPTVTESWGVTSWDTTKSKSFGRPFRFLSIASLMYWATMRAPLPAICYTSKREEGEVRPGEPQGGRERRGKKGVHL